MGNNQSGPGEDKPNNANFKKKSKQCKTLTISQTRRKETKTTP
jgi:hypothetical protein